MSTQKSSPQNSSTWFSSISAVNIHNILQSLLSSDSNHLESLISRYLGSPATAPTVAFLLGISLSFGAYLSWYSSVFRAEGVYLVITTVFHLLEFVYVSKFHPEECTMDSFLVNHSKAFVAANILAQVEYFVELALFGSRYKANVALIAIGTVLCVAGQFLRTGAMFQAGSHFHHLIQEKQSDKHKLMTKGFYSFSRHPSYLGWFLWAVSTQIVLANPVMLVLYTVACFSFFRDRINYEEKLLLRQYGKAYEAYMEKVPTRIPGIGGVMRRK